MQGSGSKYTGHNPSGDLLFVVHKESTSCCKKPNFRVSPGEDKMGGDVEQGMCREQVGGRGNKQRWKERKELGGGSRGGKI